MKRVALLGATGSIGRQAIEIVEAHPELELCAAASGSSPLDDVDAPLKQVGGDLTELLERSEPDVVLNAVVGFAGVHATLWALERGVDLALANKESLVAAGELALEARRGAAAARCRSTASTPRSSSAWRAAGRAGAHARADRLRRPVPRPHTRRARERHAGGGACSSNVAHGPEDHDRLRDAREQGTRGDRGALPLRDPYERIEVVLQPTSIVHSLVRFRDGAALAHLGYPDMRVPISYALTYPERAATPIAAARPHLGSRSSSRRRISRRSRCSRSRARRGRKAARTRAPTTPRTRSPSPPSSPAGCRSSALRRSCRRARARRRCAGTRPRRSARGRPSRTRAR